MGSFGLGQHHRGVRPQGGRDRSDDAYGGRSGDTRDPLRRCARRASRCSIDASQRDGRIQEWNTFLEEARRIKDEKHFTGPTPESEQAFTAELVFMRLLAENNLWHQIGDAWVTGLLPKGHLVHFKKGDTHAFVLKTYVNVALCWPAERVAINMWRKARDCESLVWQTIFDLEEADVVPTEYLSPIHLFKKGHRFPSAYQQRIVGGEMPGEHVQTSSRTSRFA